MFLILICLKKITENKHNPMIVKNLRWVIALQLADKREPVLKIKETSDPDQLLMPWSNAMDTNN